MSAITVTKRIRRKVTNPLVDNYQEKCKGLPEVSPTSQVIAHIAFAEADELRTEAEQIIRDQQKRSRRRRYFGRPTEYTQLVADRVCRQIAQGYSLRSIVAVDPHIPSRATIYRWLKEHPQFRDQYAQAQQLRADAYFDMALEIACGEPDINRARLIVDTLKWAAGKLSPKKYGKQVLFDGEVRQFNAVSLILQQMVSKPELLAEIVSERGMIEQLADVFQLPGSSDPETAQGGKSTQPQTAYSRVQVGTRACADKDDKQSETNE